MLEGKVLPSTDWTDTKFVSCVSTLGTEITAVRVTLDKLHPKSSGGQAHFELSPVQESIADYEEFQHGTGDVHLFNVMNDLVKDGTLTEKQKSDLEKTIRNAFIVLSRKTFQNYNFLVRTAKYKCNQFMRTEGEDVTPDLSEVPEHFHAFAPKMRQNFTITQLPPGGKSK